MLTSIKSDSSQVKRVLKKVRKRFIRKKPDQEPINIDPAAKYLNSDQTYTLHPTLGLIERNRKLYLGPEYLSQCFKIVNFSIEKKIKSNVLTLYLSQHEDITNFVPWEYTTKRLESYGDLDLAVWAQRIRKHYINYPKLMERYFELVNSTDSKTYNFWLETDQNVAKACEALERNYPYYKIVHFMTRDKDQLISLSYDEDFLKRLGHTVESLMSFVKEKGIPPLFENDCQIYFDIIKRFFDDILLTFSPATEGPEFMAPLRSKDGNNKETLAQFMSFLRPAGEGCFLYSFLILGGRASDVSIKPQNSHKYKKIS